LGGQSKRSQYQYYDYRYIFHLLFFFQLLDFSY
jgi:hypothetical protein